MLTQIAATALYVLLAASVLFQLVTVARLATRTARKRNASRRNVQPEPQPVAAPLTRSRATRVRRRDYRLALRTAKASLCMKS